MLILRLLQNTDHTEHLSTESLQEESKICLKILISRSYRNASACIIRKWAESTNNGKINQQVNYLVSGPVLFALTMNICVEKVLEVTIRSGIMTHEGQGQGS